MIEHIIYFITWACVVLIFSYLDLKNEELKHENELKQLYIQDLEKKLRAEIFIAATQKKEVPIKEIRVAVSKDFINAMRFPKKCILVPALAEKITEEKDVLKIKEHELYYDVSIYVVKKSWGIAE